MNDKIIYNIMNTPNVFYRILVQKGNLINVDVMFDQNFNCNPQFLRIGTLLLASVSDLNLVFGSFVSYLHNFVDNVELIV